MSIGNDSIGRNSTAASVTNYTDPSIKAPSGPGRDVATVDAIDRTRRCES